ncbi:MAG: Uma2 family endonuclease [Cyanobacteria bacterium J06621_11]
MTASLGHMVTTHSPSELSSPPANLKRWTVEEYHRLSELGLLTPGERTELIAGQIIIMVSKGTPHVTSLRLLALQFDEFLRDKPFFASAQDPIQLDKFSEPESDLVIVQGNILTYADHHPQPEDIQLVVEVADSTLQQDCNVKDKAYAQANIAEYWVLDVKHQRLHVFQKPTATGYGSHVILQKDSQVSPLSFPEITFAISSFFAPSN